MNISISQGSLRVKGSHMCTRTKIYASIEMTFSFAKLQNTVINKTTIDKSIKVLYDELIESSIIETFVCDEDLENLSLDERNGKNCVFDYHFMS